MQRTCWSNPTISNLSLQNKNNSSCTIFACICTAPPQMKMFAHKQKRKWPDWQHEHDVLSIHTRCLKIVFQIYSIILNSVLLLNRSYTQELLFCNVLSIQHADLLDHNIITYPIWKQYFCSVLLLNYRPGWITVFISSPVCLDSSLAHLWFQYCFILLYRSAQIVYIVVPCGVNACGAWELGTWKSWGRS